MLGLRDARLVKLKDRLFERRRRDANRADIGLTELEDQKDREPNRRAAQDEHRNRHRAQVRQKPHAGEQEGRPERHGVDQGPGDRGRRLQRHEKPLLADEGVVRARRGEQACLRGRLGLEAIEKLVQVAHGLVGSLIGRRARGVVAPKLFVRPDEIGPQHAAGFIRRWPELAHFEIELERSRRKGLQFRLLGAVDAIGRPDEEAVDQHEQERELPDDAADHVAGLVERVALREDALKHEAEEAAQHDYAGDNDRDGERTHFRQSHLPRTRFRDMSAKFRPAGPG